MSIVTLNLNEVAPGDASNITMNLSLAGIIPSIGVINIMTVSEGQIQLSVIENQGADRINVATLNGLIGTPYLVEDTHDIASSVRVQTMGGLTMRWGKKMD
jgi:hypothetical protein